MYNVKSYMKSYEQLVQKFYLFNFLRSQLAKYKFDTVNSTEIFKTLAEAYPQSKHECSVTHACKVK